MPKKIVIANWKEKVISLAQASDLLEFINYYLTGLSEQNFSLIICPSQELLPEAAKLLGSQMILGAQDMNSELASIGTRYVIVGHSDHRWKLGESDQIVNEKLKAILQNEMTPIVCLGERNRDDNFEDFLRQQIKDTFDGLSPDQIARCLIAYEPVWAISTNPDARPDAPESALQSMKIIAEQLGAEVPILYGGSITSVNAKDFISQEKIAGVLVGGASVNKEEFVKILSQI